MRKVLFVAAIITLYPVLLLSGNTKVVFLPDEIKVEVDSIREIVLQNMSDQEIYKCAPIYIIDDFIYMTKRKPDEVIKLSLNGEIIHRMGKTGQGPGEFQGIWGVSRFKENIAISSAYKVVICTQDLNILKEIRLKKWFNGLILTKKNRIYLYENEYFDDYHFSVYSEDFKYLRKFARKRDKPAKRSGPYKYSWDKIRETFYVPEDNGLWVSFRNRYDLWYYIDKKKVIEIKSKTTIFKAVEREYMGEKIKSYNDLSLLIAKHKDRLFYFYKVGDVLFCDIFNLSDNCKLLRRIQFPVRFNSLTHHKDHTFYGLRYDSDKENVLLSRIEIQNK
jgi:hypothetical protein